MKILFPLVAVALSALATGPCLRAADYAGAAAILQQAEAPADPAAPAPKQTPTQVLRADLQRFHAQAASLPPEEAACAWIALFERAAKSPGVQNPEMSMGVNVPMVLAAMCVLPPPPAWDALAAQVVARPQPAKDADDKLVTPVLRIVAGMLTGRHDLVQEAIDTVKAEEVDEAADAAAPERRQQVLATVQEALLKVTGDKAAQAKAFEAKIAAAATADPKTGERVLDAPEPTQVEVPDLVALVGPARAEALLKQVFLLPIRSVEIADKRTKALARKVALATGDALRFAPWNLADTLDSGPLYDLLARRFPGKPEDAGSRAIADAYHLLGLVVQGDYDRATALALQVGKQSQVNQGSISELPEEALNELATQGHAKPVAEFFARLLASHPELPYWDSYNTAAVLAGETDALLANAKAASERTDLKPAMHDALQGDYGKALLAADHIAEALPILRAQAERAEKAAGNGEATEDSPNQNSRREAVIAASRLAQLGHLLGDDALLNEQLDAVLRAFKLPASNRSDLYNNGSLYTAGEDSLGELFLRAKRGPDLEHALGEQLRMLRQAAAQLQAQSGGSTANSFAESLTQPPLWALIDLYSRAGRDADVVALLDQAPDWGVADMAGLIDGNGYQAGGEFGVQVAKALHRTGHDDAALRLDNAYLESHGGSDPGYALLLELLPPAQAEARLDELFRGDQFEERPLIWRAVLQLGQGRLDDAEKSARQAISIDPSDGDEGRGDRMRAYAVLGDILERKGDTEKAGQMRQAVKAIRSSEDADQFHSAGLLTRAVGTYEKALGFFSDAYCIQSRLAIQLTALGKLDEAMAHYERAYELMPDSFGRLESHCFGCERAFEGARAQGTAERVFRRLAAKQPNNPRVHYLLGYLRMEEERPEAAATEFREAVRLDPDYINAWKQLAANSDEPADRDRAALNLLRLDPQRKHDAPDLTDVGDLRGLWVAVEAAAKFVPSAPTAIYPLAASKAQVDKTRPARPTNDEDNTEAMLRSMMPGRGSKRGSSPSLAIAGNQVIAGALPLLQKRGEYFPPVEQIDSLLNAAPEP